MKAYFATPISYAHKMYHRNGHVDVGHGAVADNEAVAIGVSEIDWFA
jgi:hypothetical protein